MELQNPAITEAIQRHMATGNYESPEDVVMHALLKLDDYAAALVDLQESLADERAGRVRPLSAVTKEIREEYGFGHPT